MFAALQQRDMSTLEALLGDDFTLTTGRPGAEVRSRGEWLAISAQRYVLESYAFEELVVTAYPGCAIARTRYRQRGSMDSQPRNSTFRMTDVWILDGGQWQLQARHAQPVEGD